MEIFKIAAFVMVAAALTMLLRQYLPVYAVVCLTACSAILLMYLLELAHPIVEWVRLMAERLDHQSSLCVLKAAGIALVAQNMQELCRDAGMSVLAGKIELAGRCLILICALPLFETIMGELIPFLK